MFCGHLQQNDLLMNLARTMAVPLCLVAFAFLSGCDKQSASTPGRASGSPVGVNVEPVRSDSWVDRIEALARIFHELHAPSLGP